MKEKIPDDFLRQLKETVSLIDIIKEHVILKKSGRQWTGLCPFHQERTPSFTVSESKQLYYCHGCQKGGDSIEFLKEIHGLSFWEALEELAQRARLPLPGTFQSQTVSADHVKKQQAYKLNRFVAAYFHHLLSEHLPGQHYFFNKREGSIHQQKAFYIGVTPEEKNGLVSYLQAQKAPLNLALELGLIGYSQERAQWYDIFKDRLIFPFVTLTGKVVGFGGRSLFDESPKYLNSIESFLFHKSRLVFGFYEAQKFIREKKEVIVVEGYFDVLSLWAAGIENAVAICGTTLTPDHLTLFKRVAHKIILLFDGDKAGKQAMQKAMEMALPLGITLYGVFLPEKQDPDSYLKENKNNADYLKKKCAESSPLLDFFIQESLENALGESPEVQSELLKKVTAWLNLVSDPVSRFLYIEKIKKKDIFPARFLEQLWKKEKNTQEMIKNRVKKEEKFSLAVLGMHETEKAILGSFIQDIFFWELFCSFSEHLPEKVPLPHLFDFPPAREFILFLLQGKDHEKSFFSDPFRWRDFSSEKQWQSLFDKMSVSENLYETGAIKKAIIYRLRLLWSEHEQNLKKKLHLFDPLLHSHFHAIGMKEYLDVQRKMKHLEGLYGEE